MAFTVEQADWREHADAIRTVRRAVFVQEQGIPAKLEWDGRDPTCHHVLAIDETGKPIGTGRMQPDGHIGRMARAGTLARQGRGSSPAQPPDPARRGTGAVRGVVTAQVGAIEFYRRAGFIVEGDTFMEAGIRRQKMRRRVGASG